ncbi:hypothetical protein LTS10_009794 [Elasticomyces elasticus]|nr:hypothetical protein LTS10_009794 [Elasticomyces elasticus]
MSRLNTDINATVRANINTTITTILPTGTLAPNASLTSGTTVRNGLKDSTNTVIFGTLDIVMTTLGILVAVAGILVGVRYGPHLVNTVRVFISGRGHGEAGTEVELAPLHRSQSPAGTHVAQAVSV